MSVRRGVDWGEPGPLDPRAEVVSDDAAVVEAVLAAGDLTGAAPGDPGFMPEVGLLGGDLHRTLGSPRHSADQLIAGEGMRLPADLVAVDLLDGDPAVGTRYFVAHLVAGGSGAKLFSGHTVIAMNAAFRGRENVAPRAHPGDGLIDVIEGSLSWSDRLRAQRRLVTGTHLPHPDLSVRRTAEAVFELDRAVQLILDGRKSSPAARFRIRCLPDAVTVVA